MYIRIINLNSCFYDSKIYLTYLFIKRMRFHYGEFLNYVEIRKSLFYIELDSVTQWVDNKKKTTNGSRIGTRSSLKWNLLYIMSLSGVLRDWLITGQTELNA